MKSFNIIQHVDNTHTGHYSKLTKVMQKNTIHLEEQMLCLMLGSAN